jgi:hypothetical protein
MEAAHIEDLVDEVREIFVVGAHVSGGVGRELSGRGVERIGKLVDKGYDTRGRQFARWSRRGNNRDYKQVRIGISFQDEICTYEESG